MEPAKSVIKKFGGARKLAKLLGAAPSTIYRWTYPYSRNGTKGMIPAERQGDILRAAQMLGIELTAGELIQ